MHYPALHSVQAHRRSPDVHSPWSRPGSPSDPELLLAESGSITFESERLQPRADWHPNPPKRGSGANGILASTAERDTCRLSAVGLRESLGLLVWPAHATVSGWCFDRDIVTARPRESAFCGGSMARPRSKRTRCGLGQRPARELCYHDDVSVDSPAGIL